MDEFEYCRLLRIETATLRVWVEERWIMPEGMPEAAAFEEADVARGRLILDLVHTMGVNEAGVDVVIDLVDQVHGLRERLRLLTEAVRKQDEDVQRQLLRCIDEGGGEARADDRSVRASDA
jgi:chaperone modulatory protein CbpM